MSPLTVPFSTTWGASTEPSMTPCSLTDSEAVPPAATRTLPVTLPSMCRPPTNSMSPCTRAERPIRVSMRAVAFSCRLNMMALSGDVRIPDEGLPVGCHALARGSNFDGDPFGFEIGRQAHRLLDAGEVAEAVGELPGLAGRERGQIDRGAGAGALTVDRHGERTRARFLGACGPVQRKAQRIFAGGGVDREYLELLYPHGLRLRPGLRVGDAAIELQILLRAAEPGLQLADRARELRALAHLGNLGRLGRVQLHAQLVAIGLQFGNLILQPGPLLRGLYAVEPRLLPPELEHQIQRGQTEQHGDRKQDDAACRSVGAHHQFAGDLHGWRLRRPRWRRWRRWRPPPDATSPGMAAGHRDMPRRRVRGGRGRRRCA